MKIRLKTVHLESHISIGGDTRRLFSADDGVSLAMHTDKGVVTVAVPGKPTRIVPMAGVSWCEPEDLRDLEGMPEDGVIPDPMPQASDAEVVIFPPKRGRPKKS